MNCTRCGNYQAEGTFCARCGGDLQAGNASAPPYAGYGSPEGYGHPGGGQQACPASGDPYAAQGAPPGYGAPQGSPSAYGSPSGYPDAGAPTMWGGSTPPPQPFGYATPYPPTPYGYAQGYAETRHLSTEGHLLAMGFWNRLWAVLGIIGCGCVLISAFFVGAQRGSNSAAMGAGMGFVAVIGLLLFFLLHWLGVSLQRFSDGARIMAGVLVSLGIAIGLFNVLGSLGGAATSHSTARATSHLVGALLTAGLQVGFQVWMAIVLFSKEAAEICTPMYKDTVARNPQVRASMFSSPFFWIPVVLFVVLIGLGALMSMGMLALFSGMGR